MRKLGKDVCLLHACGLLTLVWPHKSGLVPGIFREIKSPTPCAEHISCLGVFNPVPDTLLCSALMVCIIWPLGMPHLSHLRLHRGGWVHCLQKKRRCVDITQCQFEVGPNTHYWSRCCSVCSVGGVSLLLCNTSVTPVFLASPNHGVSWQCRVDWGTGESCFR